jgi:hypothetical protein
MVSVMGIVSEVFGRCVEEIDVYVEVECGGVWLCCGWEYLGLIWERKAAQDRQWRWEMVPGIGCCFEASRDL